jgi:hypothetical protein
MLPDLSAVQQAQGAGQPIQRWGTPGAREVAVAFDVLLARLLRTSQLRRHNSADVAPAELDTAELVSGQH